MGQGEMPCGKCSINMGKWPLCFLWLAFEMGREINVGKRKGICVCLFSKRTWCKCGRGLKLTNCSVAAKLSEHTCPLPQEQIHTSCCFWGERERETASQSPLLPSLPLPRGPLSLSWRGKGKISPIWAWAQLQSYGRSTGWTNEVQPDYSAAPVETQTQQRALPLILFIASSHYNEIS